MRRYPAVSKEFHPRRMASEPKAEQMRLAKEAGATIVASPCVTCVVSLRDTIATWRELKCLEGVNAHSSLHLMYLAITGGELNPAQGGFA